MLCLNNVPARASAVSKRPDPAQRASFNSLRTFGRTMDAGLSPEGMQTTRKIIPIRDFEPSILKLKTQHKK